MDKVIGLLLIRGSGESGFQRQKGFMERLAKDLAKRDIDSNLIQHESISTGRVRCRYFSLFPADRSICRDMIAS